MAEQTNLKSMNEYIERLTALSAQAQSDGRTHVSDIIKNIFCHVSQDMELMDFIYKSSDEFTEAMTDVYVFLLKNRFSTDWYKLVSFINEEKQSDTDAYYKTLYVCKPDMDIMGVREILENSLSPEAFASGIRAILPANSLADAVLSVPDDSARKENERLKARIDELLAELSESRKETARANQELMSGRKTSMESKLEVERLRKAASADKTALRLLEKKIAKCSAMATDAEAINDMLISANKKLECELSNSSAQILQLNSEMAILQSQLREKSFQLESAVAELDRMKEGNRQSFVPADTPCKEEFTYPEPQTIREEPEESEGFGEEEHDNDDLPDYDTSAVIPIRNNKEEVVKHTNLLTKIFSKYQDRKFQKKTKAEQENLIFIKTMEMSVSKPKMQMIKTAFNSNAEFSRLELYKMISANASEEELAMFLGCKVPSQ